MPDENGNKMTPSPNYLISDNEVFRRVIFVVLSKIISIHFRIDPYQTTEKIGNIIMMQ